MGSMQRARGSTTGRRSTKDLASKGTTSNSQHHEPSGDDNQESGSNTDNDAESNSDDGDETPSQPYTALLKALNQRPSRGEPPHKKQRLVRNADPRAIPGNSPSDREGSSQVRPFEAAISRSESSPSEGEEEEEEEDEEDEEGKEGKEKEDEDDDDDEEASVIGRDTNAVLERPDDPFEKHLCDGLLEKLNDALNKSSQLTWTKKLVKTIDGRKSVLCSPSFNEYFDRDLSAPSADLSGLHIKNKLLQAIDSKTMKHLTQNCDLVAQMFNYRDVSFYDRTVVNSSALRRTYCLHALNHTLKTRDKVVRNNSKLARLHGEADAEYRDQGFTRPKVLILLPTRQACARVTETIVSLLQPEQQENKKRFLEAFSLPDDLSASDKPADFKELFSGNDDDRFMIGLKVTRKTLKFYSSFYTADVIIASPLGLQGKIASADKKKRDWDFLSSIEVVIVDQADAMIMQNWENVESVFSHLNLEPKESHGCDFARIRRWYLDNRAKFYRQTILLSAYNSPELNSLFDRSMNNVAGKEKMSMEDYSGIVNQLGVQVKQTFTRFETSSAAAEPDARFNHFTSSVFPVLMKHARNGSERIQGTLVFIPSYMDFLRLQNFFAYSNEAQNIAFDPSDLPCISEYSSKSQNARAKTLFQSGRHPILLYTGRVHHFYRYKLRGVKKVVLYGLPDNPVFYRELVGGYIGRSVSEGLVSPDDTSVQCLFSRYDAIRLERIVGSKRAMVMIRDKGDIFEFS